MSDHGGQKIFGEKLRQLRRQLGFSQEKFAPKIPWAKNYLSGKESAAVTTMNREKFRNLAENLGMPIDQLRGEIGAPDDAEVDPPSTRPVTVIVEPRLAQMLEEAAKAKGVSLTELARELLTDGVTLQFSKAAETSPLKPLGGPPTAIGESPSTAPKAQAGTSRSRRADPRRRRRSRAQDQAGKRQDGHQ